MSINSLLREKRISKYRLSKESKIPYTTINDICSGKADLRKCSVDTVYRIAQVLGVSVEELILPFYQERVDFELFKSAICHKLKESGDEAFLLELLETDQIRSYYERRWYLESLYLLSMLDFVSRENNIPLSRDYDDLRCRKLSEPVFPASVIAICAAAHSDDAKAQAIKSAIPEFLRHNIIESEVRNVI